MKEKILAASIVLIAPTGAFAVDTPTFPEPIDVEAVRLDLSASFPSMPTELPRRASLEEFIRDLELFRVGKIEALNERILSICEQLNEYELQINALFRDKKLGPRAKEDQDQRIRSERMQCSTSFAATSRYFKVYYDFLKIYTESNADAKSELDKCLSNDRCRTGQ